MDEISEKNFRINSIIWDLTDQDCKNALIKNLNSDAQNSSKQCKMYFEKFYILHKIGHIIMHKYDEQHHVQEARTEYCANLFAYKYLEYKGEKKYLLVLLSVIKSILQIHKAFFEFEIEKMNLLFIRYKMDLLTYVAFHFNCFIKCTTNNHEFLEVIKMMSKGKLSKINTSVILQRDLTGIELINECLVTVFELNDDVPIIELNYCSNLNVHNIDLEIT